MIPIATYPTLELAEEAGEELLAQGIEPQLRGPLRRELDTTLLVAEEDAERALAILELEPAEPFRPRPFHPCPQCGVGDPIWLGKWKLVLLLLMVAVAIGLALFRLAPPAVGMALVLFGFVLAASRWPEFECRQCRHRWTRERR